MTFKPMKGDDADRDSLTLPYMLTPKYDGLRALIPESAVLTSSLKLHTNRYVQSQLQGLTGLDGELIVGSPMDSDVFRRTSSIRKVDSEPDFDFYVFDDFTYPHEPACDRYERLQERVAKLAHPRVKLAPMVMVHTLDDLAFHENRYVSDGYEGVMLRGPHSPYKFGRATRRENWLLKLKTFIDAEAQVIGMVEQMANTNEAKKDEMGRTKRSSAKAGKVGKGTMGALQVRFVNGRYKDVECEVGTGFDDKTRQEIFDNWPAALGTFATIKFQDVGGYDKPRIPVFRRFIPVAEVTFG